jgi:mevalonate pyrophosphate decarboxylase
MLSAVLDAKEGGGIDVAACLSNFNRILNRCGSAGSATSFAAIGAALQSRNRKHLTPNATISVFE